MPPENPTEESTPKSKLPRSVTAVIIVAIAVVLVFIAGNEQKNETSRNQGTEQTTINTQINEKPASINTGLTEKQSQLLFGSNEGFGKVEEVMFPFDYKEMTLKVLLMVPDISQYSTLILGGTEVVDVPVVEKLFTIKITEKTKVTNGARSGITPGIFVRVIAEGETLSGEKTDFTAQEIVLINSGN